MITREQIKQRLKEMNTQKGDNIQHYDEIDALISLINEVLKC